MIKWISVLLILYFGSIVFLLRRYVLSLAVASDKRMLKIKEVYQSKLRQRDALSKEKVRLQNYAREIFTLYDMTREITSSLSEEESLGIFKEKLKDHAEFVDCTFVHALSAELKKLKETGDYFVFMLKGKRRKIGYLAIQGLKEEDREKVMILGHQFALALRRVHLYKEIEMIAITDSLTGLYTRRYVMERFAEEVGRAKVRKSELALLMIDVDFFKNLNDTYGHLTGDQVLTEIGSIIRMNVREIDIAGRYGGEEFCVVLPDTDTHGAKYAAKRIHRAAQEAEISAFDAKINITVSVGIAMFPQHAKDMNDLIEKADYALYRVKKYGRNNVCCFGEK